MTLTQQQEAWSKIHSSPSSAPVHKWYNWWNAKKNAPYTNNIGRRHAKGRAGGCGQILKRSFVKADVHIERVFLNYAK